MRRTLQELMRTTAVEQPPAVDQSTAALQGIAQLLDEEKKLAAGLEERVSKAFLRS